MTLRPSKKFLSDFWPGFLATLLGVILSLPAGATLDRMLKDFQTRGYLGGLSSDLDSDIDVLKYYRNASTSMPDLRLPAHGKAFEAAVAKIECPSLVFKVSDASESLEEASQLYERYKLNPEDAQILERLRVISGDALIKINNAIQAIKQYSGKNVCEDD